MHEDAITDWKNISAGVPQGSILGPTLFLLHTADIPADAYSMSTTFADDTPILKTNEDLQTATDWLQRLINVSNWTKLWKMLTVHVNLA
jgi:hypothetical protein